MQDGKTGLAVIETTQPGPPWPHSRRERGLQCRLCSSLIAHSPSWLTHPPHTQPRSAAGARLCSNLATEALSSWQTTECPLWMLHGGHRAKGRERGAEGSLAVALGCQEHQPGPSPLPVPAAGDAAALPVSLALIEHLHLPENPAPDVSQALLDDLEDKRGGG